MKTISIIAMLVAISAGAQEVAPQSEGAPQLGLEGTAPQVKPLIAVPLFANKTAGHVTRVAPGVYSDRVKSEATRRLDVDADAPNARYIESKNIEFAPGEWQLPEIAAEVATDATTAALAASGRYRLLTRSTPALKTIDSEKLFQGTGSQLEAVQTFSSLQQTNADYLLLGRINRFRVDETKGEAYGVRRWQVTTSVSLDLQLLDVNTGEIIAGREMRERVVIRIPEGVTTITGIYDWESALRSAVSKAVPNFIASIQSDASSVSGNTSTVSLDINSVPVGADVEFNGVFVGNTPCQVQLPANKGVLTITAAGYEPWSKTLVPNASMRINPVLSKIAPPVSSKPEREADER